MEERPRLTFHDGSCARCKATGDLVALSEFGKAFCEECYPEFFRRRVEAAVRRFRMIPSGARAAVAVSGGGDSGALVHALGRTRGRPNFTLTAVHLDMGLGEYSKQSREVAEAQAELAGVALVVHDVVDYGVRVEPVKHWPVCAVCGAVRRAILPKLAQAVQANVICTGHTLDDQLQFMLKNILSGRLAGPVPVLPATLGYPAKVKPLIQFPDASTAHYCRIVGLPRMTEPCPGFDPASHRFKEVFALMEQLAPMSKQQFWQVLRKVMTPADDDAVAEAPCKVCGEPTHQGTCPLCRLRAYQGGDEGGG